MEGGNIVVALSIDAFTHDELLVGHLAGRVAEVSPTSACVWGPTAIPHCGDGSADSLVKSMSQRMSYQFDSDKGALVEVGMWCIGHILSVFFKVVVKTSPTCGDRGIAKCVIVKTSVCKKESDRPVGRGRAPVCKSLAVKEELNS